MKIQNNIRPILITLILACFIYVENKAQDVTIASDKSLTVDFEKFKTFKWASQTMTDASLFVLNDAVLKARIRDAVKFELGARGYYYSIDDPDLLVNFRVLDDSTTYTGYIDSFRDENYWGPNELRKEFIGLKPDAEVRELEEDQKTYFLDKGALIVHIVNNKTGELIWTGYVSGLMDGDVFDNDKERIRKAVHQLFTQEFTWESAK